MKTFKKKMFSFDRDIPSMSVRSSMDLAELSLLIARFFLIDVDPKSAEQIGEIGIKVSKMNRVFISTENRCVSFKFPFTIVEKSDDRIEFYTRNAIEVDNKGISEALSILKDLEFRSNPSLFLYDLDDKAFDGVSILEQLILDEACYLRYEVDSIRENGKLHPKYHIDVNYSNSGTFKLGLDNSIDAAELHEIIDLSSDCSYLRK